MKIKPSFTNISILGLVLALIIFCGYLRDYLFININIQLVYLYYGHDYAKVNSSLDFLTQLSYNNLLWLKWILTAVFTIIYLLITLLAIKTIYKDKNYLQWIFWGYAMTTAISFTIYIGGAYIAYPRECFRVARTIMGVLQSPLPLMFFIPALTLLKMQKNRDAQ